MRGSFFEFNNAVSGLFVAKGALNVTSHNVANAAIKGYSRQYAEMRANRALSTAGIKGMIPTGAELYGIGQIRDFYLDKKYWTHEATLGEYSVKRQQFSLTQTIFNEFSDTGLKTQLNDFESRLQDLMTNAGDPTYRTNVIQQADALATYIRATYEAIQGQQRDINAEIASVVQEINSLGRQITSLNKQITLAEFTGDRANDLRDQRTRLIDKLAAYVNIDVKETEMNDDYAKGMYPEPEERMKSHKVLSIQINGYDFINNYDLHTLEVRERKDSTTGAITNLYRNAEEATGMYDIYFSSNGQPFNIYSPSLSGQLKGLIDLRDGNNGNFATSTEFSQSVGEFTFNIRETGAPGALTAPAAFAADIQNWLNANAVANPFTFEGVSPSPSAAPAAPPPYAVVVNGETVLVDSFTMTQTDVTDRAGNVIGQDITVTFTPYTTPITEAANGTYTGDGATAAEAEAAARAAYIKANTAAVAPSQSTPPYLLTTASPPIAVDKIDLTFTTAPNGAGGFTADVDDVTITPSSPNTRQVNALDAEVKNIVAGNANVTQATANTTEVAADANGVMDIKIYFDPRDSRIDIKEDGGILQFVDDKTGIMYEYRYTGADVEYVYEPDGDKSGKVVGAYATLHMSSDTPVNLSLINEKTGRYAADIGKTTDFKGLPYYLAKMNELVRTLSMGFNEGRNMLGERLEDKPPFTVNIAAWAPAAPQTDFRPGDPTQADFTPPNPVGTWTAPGDVTFKDGKYYYKAGTVNEVLLEGLPAYDAQKGELILVPKMLTGHANAYNADNLNMGTLFFTYQAIEKDANGRLVYKDAISYKDNDGYGNANSAHDYNPTFEVYRMTALNFKVNGELLGNPALMANATYEQGNINGNPQGSAPPNTGISENGAVYGYINLLGNKSLFREGNIGDYVIGMSGELGIDAKQSERFENNYKDVTSAVDYQRESVSGVSLDEEMADMMKFQQQFNAAARLIRAIDEVYDTLINKLGAF